MPLARAINARDARDLPGGEEVSPRSDVYSLAATMWALIAGEPPGYGDPPPLVGRFPGIADGLEATLRQGLETHPERRVASVEAFAAALGSPIGTSTGGANLVSSLPGPEEERGLLEAIARTVAGVLEAAAASIALRDPATDELVYRAAWGVGAAEVVGVRLVPGTGLAGDVVQSGEGTAVAHCREDPASRSASHATWATSPTPCWSSPSSWTKRLSGRSPSSTAATGRPTARRTSRASSSSRS